MKAEDLTAINRHAEIMKAFYWRIDNVHKKPLHKGQIQIAKDYFVRGMNTIQSQWGRNGGKTECALFIANVAAALTPGFIVMIITPELKQGKKIYWTPKRLQNYAPPEYIADVSSTELRVSYKNGSVITVDGCENYDSLRGVKPNLVIYDEFQDHSKEFHLEVMQPNLLGKNSSLIIFGTPPKSRAAYYVEFRENLIKSIKNGSATSSYYEFASSINPSIDPEKLQQIRRELIESGNEVIWYREYEGKLAFGGEDVVFPKWNPNVHWRSHAVTTSYIENDRHKMKWFTICDPGTSTCFAVMFAAYNPYTQQIFILDEIYEKDRNKTDTRQIWNLIRKKEEALFPHAPAKTWKRYYDEAAAWFQREVVANFRESLMPTHKHKTAEEQDISQIKMLMAQSGALTISDKCYWLRWEIESFVTDEEGRYPNKHNHLIDCFKYLMQATQWRLLEKVENELLVNKMEAPIKNAAVSMDIESWADKTVDDSLWINANDIYSEYFN